MIEDLLKDKNAQEKAQIKSKELAKVKLGKFTKDDFDIEIIGDIEEIDGGIELFATAHKNGEQLGFGKDGTVEIERFRFFNPPVLVDDENGEIIKESVNSRTGEIEQRKLKYDPAEAIRQSLAHTILQVGKDSKNIVKGKIGNTTSTFYAGAGDGEIRYRFDTDWDAVHDAETGTWTGPTDDNTNVQSSYYSGSGGYAISRGWFPFDTSALPDTDTIDSATVSYYVLGSGIDNNTGNDFLNVYTTTQASNITLTTADYNQVGTTAQSDTNKDISTEGSGKFYDFALNTTGIDNISKTSYTKFGCRIGFDVNDVASGTGTEVENYVQIRNSETAGTTNDPKLVVESTIDPDVNSRSIDLEASSSQYLLITDANQTGLNITGDLTLEAWVKFESDTSTYLINKWGYGTELAYALTYTSGGTGLRLRIHDGTDTTDKTVAWSPSTGVWYHIAVSYDASAGECQFYVNGAPLGALQTGLNNSIKDNNQPFAIGVNYNNGGENTPHDGLIDDVRVWNDVRTQEEITDNAWKQLDGDEAGLVGYWKLNDDLTDETSNGNDLTAVNSPVFSSTIPFPDDSPDNSHSIDLESGSSQYLDISDADQTGLDFTGDFTIELWHKPESLWGELISRWDIPSGAHKSIRITESADAGGRIKLDISANGTDVTEVYWTYIPTAGAWYHLAMTYDASAGSAELFINGVSQGTKTGLPTSLHDHGRFLIGALGANPANNFIDGLIEDVRVWNDIRTDAEIFDNMATELDGDEANLVAYWRLDNSLLDETSNDNDLTNNNSAAFSTTVPFYGSSTGVSGNSNFLMFM